MLLGMTALLLAVDGDHADCVRELLSAGASPDGPYSSSSDCVRTPLVAAMLADSTSSLRLLLQAGCNLDKPSRTTSEHSQVTIPSQLLADRQCTQLVERLILTAATALGLEVTSTDVFHLSPHR